MKSGRRRKASALHFPVPTRPVGTFLTSGYPAMTKSELIEALSARQQHLAGNDVEMAVKSMLEQMTHALSGGERIEIRGFGSFSISRRPPRVGRNPRSGEQVIIPEKLVPHFKPGKALRESVDHRVPPGPADAPSND